MDKQTVVEKVIALFKQKALSSENSIQRALQDAREAPSAMESASDTSRSEKQRMASNFQDTKLAFENTIKFLQNIKNDAPHKTVQDGTLIEACENDVCSWYFILPFGGGDHLQYDNTTVITLSSESPLGKLFMNKKQKQNITLQTPKGARIITINSVC